MDDLRQMLQDKKDWLGGTRDAKYATAKLTREQLALLVRLLEPVEAVGSLPKIEPRMLGAMEPRGTSRSPAEVARLLAERYRETGGFEKVLHTCA
jgi:hypothetical protein